MSQIVNHSLSLSVCICTYNRDVMLNEMLASLAMNKFQKDDEVIVIDNNSDDRTKVTAETFRHKLPLRYFLEKKQGLSNARNRALREARANHLLFLDDDLIVEDSAIDVARAAILDYPKYDFFGGRIDVLWPGETPSWWLAGDFPLLNGLLGKYQPDSIEFEY
ncbi:MAG: glycosyltransferase, partial [Pseudomonadota bacterium]